ncbi:MAG TPA: carboxypeptidase-like regulatory domain-containing protein [Flavobacterium sp.]|nr:carboxypeptidase-like regulatory domain-containing protein [Flavobacterium sp.]
MKKLVISTLFVMQAVLVFAQTATGISGKVVDAKTQKPLQDVVATIQNTNFTQVSDASGKFAFTDIAAGNQLLEIKTQGYKPQLLQIAVVAGKMLDLGIVVLEEDITEEQQTSLITITENDLGDDNSGSESTSGLLQASRDAFQQAAAFNWGQARFRVRGLDNEYGTTMINGITMNKIYDGRPQWSNWGGLNDATRNQEFTMGSAPSDYTFGGILGTQEINTRASIYRPGVRLSYAATNTNYTGRVMGTVASGMRTDGWAYVVSASRRFANDGYFDGTTYSANSLFASVERKLSSRNFLNLTAIYAQNERGKNSPNTQEVTDLKDELYNSYWGYQNGRKRNSRVKNVDEPMFILSDYWKITDKTNLNTNVAYQFGQIGNSRLTYQGADNPDPTYYRYLPSYQTAYFDADTGAFTPNYAAGAALAANFVADGQLNWDNMIAANQKSGDGHSYYTLYEDRTDDKLFTANTILSSQLADNIFFNGGVTYRNLKSHNFQNMLDLLGGSYFNDVTLYGTGTNQQQSDLNNPGRQVGVGDTFGYNYNLTANNIDAFTQFKFAYKKFDFYLSQSYSRAEYQREGLYKNGYYPTNSFGKSDKVEFDNFGFKGGLTYKITGRQFLNFNAVYMTKAPSMRNTFNNARVNNNVIDGVSNEKVTSLDASYIISMPKLKTRLTAFYSKMENVTETSFFFSDNVSSEDAGGDTDLFVAETVSGLAKRNIGLELGIEYPITSTLKVTASAAYGEYIYANNPNVSLNVDDLATATNTKPVLNYGQAKLKDYKQAGMPQQAASVGLEYRDPKFWWVGANMNYLGNSYIDVSPITRTSRFYDQGLASGVPAPNVSQEDANALLKQEKFDSFYLLNLSGGKSWRVKGNTIGLFATVNNVLDVSYKTGGFEQARNGNYTQLSQDVSSGTPQFGPKYFYGYGRTYFLNLYVTF